MNFSIFKVKTAVGLEEFCQVYYEDYFLSSKRSDNNLLAKYLSTFLKPEMETDNILNNGVSSAIMDELIIVRLEVFAIAWTHRFGLKLAIKNSVFTKGYLEMKSRIHLWDNSEMYNLAVAQSTSLSASTNNAFERGRNIFFNTMRLSLFKEYTKKGYDPVCVARSINRYSSEYAWRHGLTADFLTTTLYSRLNCKLSNVMNQRVSATIRGFYVEAMQSLSSIRVRK